MRLYIDTETVPTQNKELMDNIRSSIKPPGNYKKQESIDKWIETEGEAAYEAAYRKTALSGTTGEIICISYAIDDLEPVNVWRRLSEPEDELLRLFFTSLGRGLTDSSGKRKPVWIGHNITGFDLRFIWQRCVINKVKPSIHIPHNSKPWSEDVFDTLFEWTGDKVAGGSLDKISKAMGYEGKGEITGANVWDYVKAGKEDEVANYCADDVILTRNLYKRMTFQ